MANIRELQARFVAQASGFKATIQGMKKDMAGLEKVSANANKSMGSNFRNGALAIQGNMQKASKGFTDFGNVLGNASKKVEDVGWSLTKKLTAPVGIAIGAVGGLVAKMGWDRLKSIDEAQAQLEGLGYTAEQQKSIIATVTKAIDGGMTTMGEGIMISAGALASGVKEGAELERYIRLVGDASISAKRPVEEMALIFNRVQGGGKLMTRELNMIELGMPGFSKALARGLGVPLEKLPEMVTAGKVNSEMFLDTMDEFAGGMAGAYANTWSGMVDNTKAYISILGAQLMGGVFEKSKKSIREFLDIISSDEANRKATALGESVGKSFVKMVDGAKSLVKWFMNLNMRTQKIILGFGAFMVALGPALILIGKLGGGIAMVSKGFGLLFGFIAKAITPLVSLGKAGGVTGKVFGVMSKAVAGTGMTIGALVGWFAVLVGVLIGAWKYSKSFRDSVAGLGKSFRDLWKAITSLISPMGVAKGEFGFFKNVVVNVYEALKIMAEIMFEVIGKALAFVINTVTLVIDVFTALLSGVKYFVDGFKLLFAGDFQGALELFKKGVRESAIAVADVFRKLFATIWKTVKNGFTKIIVPFGDGLGNMMLKAGKWALDLGIKIGDGLGNVTIAFIKALPKWALAFADGLGNMTVSALKWIGQLIIDMVGGLGRVGIYVALNVGKWALSFVKGLGSITIAVVSWLYNKLPKEFRDGLARMVSVIATSIVDWTKAFVKGTVSITKSLVSWAIGLPKKIKDGLISAKDNFIDWFTDKRDEAKEKTGEMTSDFTSWAKALPGKIGKALANAPQVFEKWLKDQHEQNKDFYGGLGGKAGKWLSEKAGKITGGLKKWGTAFAKFFGELPGKIGTKASEMYGVFSDKFLDKKDEITKKLSGWGSSIATFFGGMAGKIGTKASEMWKTFSTKFLDKKDAITKKLSGWGSSIATFFTEMPGKIRTKAGEMWEAFSTKFLDKKGAITKKMKGWGSSVLTFFTEMPGKIKDKASEMWNNFKEKFLDKKESVVKGMKNWTTGIVNWFKEIGPDMKERAGNLATNFKDGITNAKDKVVEGFNSWKDGITGWFKNLGKDKKIKDSGKDMIKTVGDGVKDKKTQDDMLAKIGKLILKIPLYIMAIGGVLLLAVGRELIKYIIKGFKGGWSLFTRAIKDFWKHVQIAFKWGINLVVKFFTSGFVGKLISSVTNFAKSFGNKIKGMWNRVRNTFSTVIISIYKFVKQSFIGKIITAIINFVKTFTTRLSNMWKKVKHNFSKTISAIYNAIKKSFVGRIITSIIGFVKNFKKRISDMWTYIRKKFQVVMQSIVDRVKNSFIGNIVRNIIGFVKNFKKRISNMWSSVKKTFSSYISSIYNSIKNSFVGRMIKSITGLKDRFIKIAKDMWGGVKKQFKNIVDGAKGLPKKIGDGIRTAKDKAISGMTSVGRGIISAFGKPIRGIKSGINWVLGKFGVPTIKGTWGMKNVYAQGTKKHPGGLAVVGDGVGSNAGQELINTGSTEFLSPNVPTMMNLPKGTSVLSATDTRNMLADAPKYALGTEDNFGIGGPSKLDKMKKSYGTEGKDKRTADTKKALEEGNEATKKAFGDIWDWIKKPKDLLKFALNKVGIDKPEGIGAGIRMAKGGFKKAKEGAIEKIKSLFVEQEQYGEGGGKPSFGWPVTSGFGNRIHPITGKRTFHSGIDFGAPGGTPIKSQTAGKVSFSGMAGGYGNLVRVQSGMLEVLYGHMRKRLVKTGQGVSIGKILGLVGTTGDSTGNHLHYETRKNGKPVNPMKQGTGASGSVAKWIAQAIASTGSPKSWQGPLQTIAMKESGGKTGQGTVNKWDSNWRRGTPSMGLMQTIRPTFNAYKKKGMDNIMNPVHNAVASINYIKSRYGTPFNTPGIKSMSRGGPYKGYADGGIVNQKQLSWIAEGGWAESIISHDPAKKVRQKAIWNETGEQLGFKDNAVDERVLSALQRIAEAVESDRTTILNMDTRQVAKIIEPRVSNKQNRKDFRGRGARA